MDDIYISAPGEYVVVINDLKNASNNGVFGTVVGIKSGRIHLEPLCAGERQKDVLVDPETFTDCREYHNDEIGDDYDDDDDEDDDDSGILEGVLCHRAISRSIKKYAQLVGVRDLIDALLSGKLTISSCYSDVDSAIAYLRKELPRCQSAVLAIVGRYFLCQLLCLSHQYEEAAASCMDTMAVMTNSGVCVGSDRAAILSWSARVHRQRACPALELDALQQYLALVPNDMYTASRAVELSGGGIPAYLGLLNQDSHCVALVLLIAKCHLEVGNTEGGKEALGALGREMRLREESQTVQEAVMMHSEAAKLMIDLDMDPLLIIVCLLRAINVGRAGMRILSSVGDSPLVGALQMLGEMLEKLGARQEQSGRAGATYFRSALCCASMCLTGMPDADASERLRESVTRLQNYLEWL